LIRSVIAHRVLLVSVLNGTFPRSSDLSIVIMRGLLSSGGGYANNREVQQH